MKIPFCMFAIAFSGMFLPKKTHGQVSEQLPLRSAHAAFLQPILEKQASRSVSSKNTASKQRITAFVQKDHLYNTVDSVVYLYSTSVRGANHNPKILESYYLDIYRDATMSQYPWSTEGISIFCDSAYSALGNVRLGQTFGLQYDADNRLTTFNSYADNRIYSTYKLFYNSFGQRERTDYYQDSNYLYSAPPVLYNQQFHTYTVSGFPRADSVFGLPIPNRHPSRKFEYVCDAAGRRIQTTAYWIINGSLYPNYRYDCTYNTDGLLKQFTRSGYDFSKSSWGIIDIDSFGYDGNNAAYTHHTSSSYDWQTDNFILSYRTLGHLNGRGNWDTLTYQVYDIAKARWRSYLRRDIQYNDQSDYRQIDLYDGDTAGRFVNKPSIHQFYYETYGSTAGVTTPAGVEPLFTVHPNPNTDFFTITGKAGSGGTGYVLSDAAGRVVIEGALRADGRAVVQTTAYAPGLYFLTLRQGGAAPQTQRLVIRH